MKSKFEQREIKLNKTSKFENKVSIETSSHVTKQLTQQSQSFKAKSTLFDHLNYKMPFSKKVK